MNQLIRCVNCDEVFMKTPFDQIPEYELNLSDTDKTLRIYEKNDFRDFLQNHYGHKLEELKIIEDSFISEKEYFEPVKISYFKATNGKEKFVIKKFRNKIDEQVRYELIHGDYFLKCVSIEIQENEIRKELKRILPSISQKKIDKFINVLYQILKKLELKDLERANGESFHPLKLYYKMDDISLAYLLRNCRNIFNTQEYNEIESFIYENMDEGVLLFLTTFEIQIKQFIKKEEKMIRAYQLEKKAVLKKD